MRQTIRTIIIAIAVGAGAFLILHYLLSDDEGPQEEEKIVLEEPRSSVVGTKFEPVVEMQSRLAKIFDPEVTGDQTGEAILSMVRTFEEQEYEKFKADCKAMLDYYASDTAHLILVRAEYGRLWLANSQLIRNRVQQWTPGQQESVKQLLDRFTCR